MKKITLVFMVFVMVLCLSSCEKEPKDIAITTSAITLYYEDTQQLTTEGEGDVVWSSDDKFVAKVSNSGMVTANHVGTTYIKANESTCEVTVKPKYYLYEDPIMEWGLTKADMIRRLGEPFSIKGDIITYKTGTSSTSLVMYMFDDQDKLETSAQTVPLSLFSTLLDFLMERYQVVAVDSDELIASFINAMTLSESTLFIATQPNISVRICMTIYMNSKTAKTKSSKEDYVDKFMKACN